MTDGEKLIRNEAEAIECLKSNKPTNDYMMLQESVDFAIQALEKQIQLKPLHSYDKTVEEMWCSCPTCYVGLGWEHGNAHKYCMNCGQKLDWSDGNED